MTGPPAASLRQVTKRFGDVSAVERVDLEVGPGEVAALVGPSGCGKSTLLRLVAGLHDIDEGTVLLSGSVVDDSHRSLPPEQRRVGLMFQEHALFPHLSVSDNIGFGLRRHPDRRGRVSKMIDLVGLQGYGHRYPHELSGGERQRVALARALAPHPSVMLLDEPFASLDPTLRGRLRREVTAILRAAGTAVVFVTHDQSEALAVGDRVVVMQGGRLVQSGTPEEVFQHPATRFVASFMGEADFLTPADIALVAPGAEGTGVAMVRPDDLTFAAGPAGECLVVGAEFRGSTWCYELRLPSGTIVRSIRPHLERVDVGTPAAVSLVPGHEVVFVAEDAVPS